MKMKLFILIITANLLFLIGCHQRNSEPKTIAIVNFNGLKPWLNKHNDSTYVINFWATWCAPCVREFPNFERLQEENQKGKVKVLMVNLDFPDQYKKRVIPFIKSRNSKLDVIMLDDPNQNQWINLVDSAWSGAIPATLVYNAKRRSFLESELSFPQLDSLIKLNQ